MKIVWLCVLAILFCSTFATELEKNVETYVEKRQDSVGDAFQDGFRIGRLIARDISRIISNLKNHNNKVKSDFTYAFVTQAVQKYPGWSVAILHKAKTSGNAVHQHVEVPLTIGTYGYEVYFVKPGTHFDIWRVGDGGYINWAFVGTWKQKNNHIWV